MNGTFLIFGKAQALARVQRRETWTTILKNSQNLGSALLHLGYGLTYCDHGSVK